MKIGISGAQSVGKTTLLNVLRKDTYFSNYAFETEIVRKLLDKGMPGFSINETGNDVSQRMIILEVLAATVMNEDVVMDRTLLDTFVYSKHLYNHGKLSNEMYNFAFKSLNELKGVYDVIFYIRPEFEIVADGVRNIDEQYRNEIVSIFDNTIQEFNIPVVQLSGTVENRLQQFWNTI